MIVVNIRLFENRLRSLIQQCNRAFRVTFHCFDSERLPDRGPGWDVTFTRSMFCKPEVKNVIRDGKVIQITTGLVDQNLFAPVDPLLHFHMSLFKNYDFDLKRLASWAKKRLRERNRLQQLVSDKAIQHLGVDLAVAHMVHRIGGRVKFIDNPRWYFRHAYENYALPSHYAGDLKLESIDLSGTNVVYEGFEFIPQLERLRHLRLRRCMHVDDFCISRVGRIRSLELLDIGECPRITHKGLASLAQLKSLQRLLLPNNPTMENKELVCLLLETHLPNLQVYGVDYLEALPEDSRQKILALTAANHNEYKTSVLLCDEPKVTPETASDFEEGKEEHVRVECT